jgi:uncharacterized protein with HEPN domain
MSDLPLLQELLDQCLEGIRRVERRFIGIDSPGDFTRDEAGVDRLDGIGMMLIAIGENLKNFERKGGAELMARHTEVDWKGVKGIRDFVSHHYFSIDPEIVFDICQDKLPGLKIAITAMRAELNH